MRLFTYALDWALKLMCLVRKAITLRGNFVSLIVMLPSTIKRLFAYVAVSQIADQTSAEHERR